MTELRRTPLAAEHKALGGKLVPFNGWEMPLQYAAGIVAEHHAVRRAAGLFDVSHMARYEVTGEGAVAFVDSLITNNLAKLSAGRLLYTPMCREDGGVLDDVTVYRFDDRVWVVVNAGNSARIWAWLTERRSQWAGAPCQARDLSGALGQIAFQGPRAQETLAPHAAGDLDAVPYYGFQRTKLFEIDDVVVSRNGYTGEDGFELYASAERLPELWRAILDVGGPLGATPAGLGCRDTLRLEMGYCLYGNELDLDVTPLEARLQWTVKLAKPGFVGQAALEQQKREGLTRTLAPFVVEGQRLVRKGQVVLRGGDSRTEIGRVTSAGYSPSLERGIGLAFVPPTESSPGTRLSADVRGEQVAIEIVEAPFYKQASHR